MTNTLDAVDADGGSRHYDELSLKSTKTRSRHAGVVGSSQDVYKPSCHGWMTHSRNAG